MIKSISKKDGKIIAQALQELLKDADAKASEMNTSFRDSFWKGYVAKSIEHMSDSAERGNVWLNDKK